MAWTQWCGYEAHLLPGRVRVRLPGLLRNRSGALRLAAILRQLNGVHRAQANADTGSILVLYNPRAVSLAEIGGCLGLVSTWEGRAPGGLAIPSIRDAAKQTALTGLALASVGLKRLVLGPSRLAGAWWTYDLAGIVTVVASYPYLRRGLERLIKKGRLTGDVLVGAFGLTALLLRENLIGLTVLFATNLKRYLLARALREGEEATACHPLGQQCEAALLEESQRRASRWGWGAMGLAAAVGALTWDWRRALATLIAAAPSASSLGATLPLFVACAASARLGVPVRAPGEIVAASRVSLEAAGAMVVSGGLGGQADLIRIGRRAMAVVRQNGVATVILNTAGLALAATGALGPLGASIWHNVTSLVVVGNSARLFSQIPWGEAVGGAGAGVQSYGI